ncbi:hypothetical protein BC940DRAFT_306745, partial [Gongronella butleri]
MDYEHRRAGPTLSTMLAILSNDAHRLQNEVQVLLQQRVLDRYPHLLTGAHVLTFHDPDNPNDQANLNKTTLWQVNFLLRVFGVCNRCCDMTDEELPEQAADNQQNEQGDGTIDRIFDIFGARRQIHCVHVPHHRGVINVAYENGDEEYLCHACRLNMTRNERLKPLGLPKSSFMSSNEIADKLAFQINQQEMAQIYHDQSNPARIRVRPCRQYPGSDATIFKMKESEAKRRALELHGGYAGIAAAVKRHRLSRLQMKQMTLHCWNHVFGQIRDEIFDEMALLMDTA